MSELFEKRVQFSPHAKMVALKREINFRLFVYERRVGAGGMDKATAEEQIAVFEAILNDYERNAGLPLTPPKPRSGALL